MYRTSTHSARQLHATVITNHDGRPASPPPPSRSALVSILLGEESCDVTGGASSTSVPRASARVRAGPPLLMTPCKQTGAGRFTARV
eukprot:3634563-Prymnesium_polylepis.1